MSLILGFKLVLVPALIGAVTLAGRRWGPSIAGWLSGFPIVVGPILFFVVYEQGTEFGVTAALGTLLGLPAVLAFNVTYCFIARKAAWLAALSCALLSYGLTAYLLLALSPPAWFIIVLVAALLRLGPRLFPRDHPPAPPRKPGNGHAELAYRMLAAALLVLAVTHFAATLGPQLSGLFAMFPVISIVLASFSHHHNGAAFVTNLLKGVILGWHALAAFCLLLYLLLPYGEGWMAFVGATLGASLVQLASRAMLKPR